MKFDKKQIFTIPNILTYIRILCVPFFIWFFLDESIPHNIYLAFGVFIFASVTDLVDGFIARHFKLVSDIGKVADPIADKLLLVSTLVCMTITGRIHWGFPLIFFIKETYMVLGGSAIVKIFKSEYVLQSNIFGKGATCLNSLGVVLAFFTKQGNQAYDTAVIVILGLGATFAVVTAVIYTIQFFKFRKKELVDRAITAVSSADNEKTNEVIVDAEVQDICDSDVYQVEEANDFDSNAIDSEAERVCGDVADDVNSSQLEEVAVNKTDEDFNVKLDDKDLDKADEK